MTFDEILDLDLTTHRELLYIIVNIISSSTSSYSSCVVVTIFLFISCALWNGWKPTININNVLNFCTAKSKADDATC